MMYLRAAVIPCLGTSVQGTIGQQKYASLAGARNSIASDSLVLRKWPPRATHSKAAMLLWEEAGQEQPSAAAGQKH